MSNFKNKIYKNLLYPLYQYKYGSKILNILKSLNKTQWISRKELSVYQYEKLRKLIKHVYSNVPYYRDIMDDIKLKPENIKNLKNLEYLPILTKKEIRENYDKLISKDIKKRKTTLSSTGGTTGEPFEFLKDKNTIVWSEACSLRGKSWAEYKIGDTTINFKSVGKPSLLGRIRGFLINNYYFPAFESEDHLLDYIEKSNKLNPRSISSYASNLYRIARVCKEKEIDYVEYPIIFSTGEMLYDYQRDLIEDQFKGKIFDYYGCNEIGSLAFECEYHEKHISEEHVLIEIIDSNDMPVLDSSGEFTITDLDNYVMPFIRYKNGDKGQITNELCRCGRNLKKIKSLEGRQQEFLRTFHGSYIPGIFFPFRFRYLKGIDQYQIVQKNIDNITLKIVKNQFFSPPELQNMIQVIKKMIDGEIKIKVEEYDRIKLTSSGKARQIISYISNDIFK